MPIFRIEKSSNYSVVSNDLIHNKNMTLTSRGLLVFMLSLPNDWDFSCKGLMSATNTKEATLRNCLKELEQNGYLKRESIRDKGKIKDWVYWIYESPLVEKQQVVAPVDELPVVEKPVVESPLVVKHAQLNTNNKQNTEFTNNKTNKEFIYFESKDLNQTFINFIDHRKKMNSPMTEVAIKQAIEKLNSMSSDENEKIEILNQSIINGWKGIFPLKKQRVEFKGIADSDHKQINISAEEINKELEEIMKGRNNG